MVQPVTGAAILNANNPPGDSDMTPCDCGTSVWFFFTEPSAETRPVTTVHGAGPVCCTLTAGRAEKERKQNCWREAGRGSMVPAEHEGKPGSVSWRPLLSPHWPHV